MAIDETANAPDKVSFDTWLRSLLPCAAAARDISLGCIEAGFLGLDRSYGGAFSPRIASNSIGSLFEEELIKEEFCRAFVKIGDIRQAVGYESSLVTSELAKLGLDRGDLLSLGRSSAADAALAAASWGARFTRSNLALVRSDDGFLGRREAELDRETKTISLVHMAKSRDPIETVVSEFEGVLAPRGFANYNPNPNCVIFRASGMRTAFLLRLGSLSGSFPINFSVFVFPTNEFFGVIKLAERAVHTPFARWLGSLIPNLPIYQIARSPERLALALALNVRVLERVLPHLSSDGPH